MLKVTCSIYFNKREEGASNSGFIVRENDVVFVDNSDWLGKTKVDLDYLSVHIGKPIKFLVNTHFHPDHTFGNQLFNCDIIASDKAPELFKLNEMELLKWLREENVPEVLQNLRAIKITYPTKLVEDRTTLDDSHPLIKLIHLGGHTPDSLVVFVPEENAIFTGDLIFQGSHPFMVGSNINEWLSALEWLKSCGATLFLPGHGEPCSRKDVEFMYSYLIKFKKSLAVFKAKGMTAEEIARKPDMLQLPHLDKPQRIAKNVMFHYEKV